jgi:hypothetical protein
MGFRERPAQHGEVLGEDKHGPARDLPVAGEDPVTKVQRIAWQRVGRGARDKCVELDKRAGIQKEVESLASCELAGGMLALNPFGSPAEQCPGLHFTETPIAIFVR